MTTHIFWKNLSDGRKKNYLHCRTVVAVQWHCLAGWKWESCRCSNHRPRRSHRCSSLRRPSAGKSVPSRLPVRSVRPVPDLAQAVDWPRLALAAGTDADKERTDVYIYIYIATDSICIRVSFMPMGRFFSRVYNRGTSFVGCLRGIFLEETMTGTREYKNDDLIALSTVKMRRSACLENASPLARGAIRICMIYRV